MPMNFVQIEGVIESTPEAITLPNFQGVTARMSINPKARNFQVVDLVATNAVGQELLLYGRGDRVLLRGHLTVSAKTNKLQIFADRFECSESLPKSSCVHHLQIPQMAGGALMNRIAISGQILSGLVFTRTSRQKPTLASSRSVAVKRSMLCMSRPSEMRRQSYRSSKLEILFRWRVA